MAYGDAPIQAVISAVDSSLATAVNTVAGAISGVITPIAAACFSIYMILITVNYVRGASSEPVWDFWLRMAGFALIIGLGVNYRNYSAHVVPIVTKLGNDLSSLVSGGSDTATALDQQAMHYIGMIGDEYDKISKISFVLGGGFLWAIKSLIIILTLFPFLIFAAALLIVAKVGAAMVAAVGPLFFACLLFPATRQYFTAWLNSAVSYALIPLFVAVVAMFSINISKDVFADPNDMSFMTVLVAAIVNLLLILLLKTCSALASSLSAGGINTGFSPGGMYGSIRSAATYKGTGLGKKVDEKFHDAIGEKVGRGVDAISSVIQSFRQNKIKAG